VGVRSQVKRVVRAVAVWSGVAPPIPPNSQNGRIAGAVHVSNATALRASAVWACLRTRADLVSTMPLDTFRNVNGVSVEVPKPPVLVHPDGDRMDMGEFLWATQFDLDRAGNAFGVITEVNALGLPARIELVDLEQVGVVSRDGKITVRVGGDTYDYAQIWHEKQFAPAGCVLGLSPVAQAAFSIGSYLSAQAFALDWFGNSAMPAISLQNTKETVSQPVAEQVRTRYQASAQPGGVFVHGNDWDLKPITGIQSQNSFVELMQLGVPDIARFFGVPADLIDGAVSGSGVTYANITQRNLQFLIMQLGPAITRRERALSTLLPGPRFVKLNRSALLAMDPQTRATTLKVQLDSRQITPSEARAFEDRPPLTDADIAEFDRVYGAPRTNPMPPTSDPQSTGVPS
jgi:HK97 family phage portal protein